MGLPVDMKQGQDAQDDVLGLRIADPGHGHSVAHEAAMGQERPLGTACGAAGVDDGKGVVAVGGMDLEGARIDIDLMERKEPPG